MLITDGGLVPKGNPDKIQGSAATRWGSLQHQRLPGFEWRGLRNFPRRLRSAVRSPRSRPVGAVGRHARPREGGRHRSSCTMNLSPLPACPIRCRTPGAWGGRWRPKPNSWVSMRSYLPRLEGPALAAALRLPRNWKKPAFPRCKLPRHCRWQKWSAPTGWSSAMASFMSSATPRYRPRTKRNCGVSWWNRRWRRCKSDSR